VRYSLGLRRFLFITSLDSVFVARVYSSDSAEMRADTSGGHLEHIQDWEIDLSDISLFKRNARNSPSNRFDTGDFSCRSSLRLGV
jgi:hypothetical protein